MATVVLASASAARAAILTAAGVDFTVRTAPIDERAVEAPLLARRGTPAEVAAALADAKAIAVSRLLMEAVVIGADQVLDFDGERWIKPDTIAAARGQLRRLAGRSHSLATAVAIARGGTVVWRHLEAPRLTMRPLVDAEIDAYLARVGYAVLTSVGAYQVEGLGIQLFEAIAGDHFAILGLPLLPLLAELRRQRALSLVPGSR